MADALGLEQLHLAAIAARLELPVVPQPPLLEQDVLLGHAHLHALARDRGGGGARRVVDERVHARVVQPGRLREHEPPCPVEELADVRAERRLGAHGLLAGEVGVDHHEAAEGHPVRERAAAAAADGHVVGDVGAGAAAGEEQAGEVGVVEQPRVGAVPARRRPPHGRPRVLVRRRERVLRREAVVHGHPNRAGPGHEIVEVGVGARPGGRAGDEPAAMEVHHDGELLGGHGGAGREVDARPGGAGVDVAGDDAGDGVGAGGDGGGAAEAEDAAALVLAEVGLEVEGDLGVGIHGGWGAVGGRIGRRK